VQTGSHNHYQRQMTPKVLWIACRLHLNLAWAHAEQDHDTSTSRGLTGSPTRRATDIAQHTARGVCLRLCQLCPIVFRIFVYEVCRLAKHFIFVIMPFSFFLLLIKISRKDPRDLTSCSVRDLIFLRLSRPHFTEAKLRSALH